MKPTLTPRQYKVLSMMTNAMRRNPFYTGADSAHLGDAKHSRAYTDFGYPKILDFFFFYTLYKRCGLAFAGVERPVDMSWLTPPMIKLTEDKEDEDFKAWARKMRLWPTLRQVDVMQRVGHYAGLILTIADGKHPSQPVDSISIANIVDIMPAWEAQLVPGSLEQDIKSPRYGLPISYTYTQRGTLQTTQRDGTDSYTVHHSRVLIWNEGAAGRTIYGTSAIEPAFNACLDWEKIRGSGAEGFFKQAAMRGWLQQTMSDNGMVQPPTPDQLEELADAFRDMNERFDAVPYLGGMELKNFTANMQNPQGFKDAALEDAAAGFKWSAKGLIGAQEGVLAGDQDASLDKQTAQSRRLNYLTYQIEDMLDWLRAHCTDFEGDRIVEWGDLSAPSDSQRLDNALKMQQINQAGAMTGIIPYTAKEIRTATGYESEDWQDEFVDGGDVPDNE